MIHFGDWSASLRSADLIICTTNSILRTNGSLVMGAGTAKAVRDFAREEGVDLEARFGEQITQRVYHLVRYQKFVGLQTKLEWWLDSPLWLVEQSINELALFLHRNEFLNIHMPVPAIGQGGRKMDEVLPLLQTIPDCVHIWMLPRG